MGEFLINAKIYCLLKETSPKAHDLRVLEYFLLPIKRNNLLIWEVNQLEPKACKNYLQICMTVSDLQGASLSAKLKQLSMIPPIYMTNVMPWWMI